MDKRILARIEDEEKRLAISKIIDTVNLASGHCEAKFTHFLDPATIYFINNNLCFDADVNVCLWGGYDGAERQMMCASPEWESVELCDFPIKCIKAQLSDFDEATHRDYLGSLMGLGIDRAHIGDIVVLSDGAYIFCKSDIADYITDNLAKIGRGGVKISIIDDIKDICVTKEEKEEKLIISSLRLDAVLSAAFNISRAQSAQLVKTCRVKVNFEQCINLSRNLSCGDLISVRGFGRLKIGEEEGQTRKGRKVLSVIRYL